MNSVEDLDIFKLAHELALKIYSLTKRFPSEEAYSLIDHMRQTATSVGMNLMESAMRLGTKEYRSLSSSHADQQGGLLSVAARTGLEVYLQDIYQELRSGYDRLIQMLSRLSQSLTHEPRTRSR